MKTKKQFQMSGLRLFFCDRKSIVCIYYGELQGIKRKEEKWKSILHCP